MRITLPWPDPLLSPNARAHWRKKLDPKKQARKDGASAAYAALSGGLREVRAALHGEGPIPVEVTFYPPDRRHRDDDNMIGSFKHFRDGIADALGVNDRRFRPQYVFADAAKPGRIEVTIRDRSGEKFIPAAAANPLKKNGPDACSNTVPGPDRERIGGAP